MPSSSLVEVGVEVEVKFEVGVEVEVKVRAQNYFFRWVAGEMENKTIFQLEVEVEVEVGTWQFQHKTDKLHTLKHLG